MIYDYRVPALKDYVTGFLDAYMEYKKDIVVEDDDWFYPKDYDYAINLYVMQKENRIFVRASAYPYNPDTGEIRTSLLDQIDIAERDVEVILHE